MSLPFTDGFSGTSGDPLSGSWTTAYGSFEKTGTMYVRSSAGSGSSSLAYVNSETFSNDHYVQGVITCSATGALGGIKARASGTGGGACYGLNVYNNSLIYLERNTGGSGGTFHRIHDFSETHTDGHLYRIECEGTTIRCYRNTGSGLVQIGTDFTDATIASGAGGIGAYLAGFGVGSFEAGNLAGGGGGPDPDDDTLLLLGC